ncbi:hypothetical protein PG985_014479 [Apiospora marii]|uniref:uncharacterized protein n=1 Tax=Apiospora marii TaxID=335849 RepID=UPI0031310B1F
MPPSQQFQYQPLGSARSTRLITLFPAPASQRDSEIIIELSECALESTIEYEALSYTWGDQQPSRDITCNGAMLRVTENVHLALRRLRSDQGQQRTLWIDALSINQQDEAEKTAQVSEMGLIYTRAKRVNVWLGYPTEVMVKYLDSRLTPSLTADIAGFTDALHQFCSSPYWTRIWTIQEVVLSSNCWVYLGDRNPREIMKLQASLARIELDIKEKWKQVRNTQDPGALYPPWRELDTPTKVLSLHKSWTNRHPTAENLRLLMTKKAKTAHDLVFACRALFPNHFGKIVVDYQRDLSDILRELTAYIIPQTYDVGSLLGLVSLCPPVPRAPSWVLNLQWDRPPKTTSHYSGLRFYMSTRSGYTQTARVLPDGKTLSLRGIVADRIALLSDLFPTYSLASQERWHNDAHTLLMAWKSACVGAALKSTFEEGLEYILYAPADSAARFRARLTNNTKFEGVRISVRVFLHQ